MKHATPTKQVGKIYILLNGNFLLLWDLHSVLFVVNEVELCKISRYHFKTIKRYLNITMLNEKLINFCMSKAKKITQVPPRFELGSLDSESKVLTITPWDRI